MCTNAQNRAQRYTYLYEKTRNHAIFFFFYEFNCLVVCRKEIFLYVRQVLLFCLFAMSSHHSSAALLKNKWGLFRNNPRLL